MRISSKGQVTSAKTHRGRDIVNHLRGKGTGGMTTDNVLLDIAHARRRS